MADNKYDGSISLGVNIEWDGAERSIKDGYSKLKGKLHDLSAKLSKAFSVKLTGGKTSKLEDDFKNATFRANALKIKLEELQNKLSELANSERKPILSELDKGEISALEEDLFYYKNLYNNAKKESLKTSYAKHIDEVQSKIDAINSRANYVFDEKTQLDIEKTNLKIEKTRYQLSRATEEAEIAKEKLEDSQNALKNLFTKVGESLKDMAKRFKNYAQRALVFYTVIKALHAVLDSFKKVLMADEEFRNDWAELKSALYVAVQPIIDLLLPIMKSLVKTAKEWAIAIGQVMAMISGKSYSQLVDIAKASKQAADDYESMADSAKSAADSTKKQLAAFDDLQQFTGTSETTSSDYDSFDNLKEYDTSSITSKLSAIAKVAAGLLVAIGLILLFKGVIKWGIGFIIAGAGLYGVTEITEKIFNEASIKQILDNIVGFLIGGALVAIGLLLIKFGQLHWGLAFIAGGAIELVKDIVESDTDLTEMVRGTLGGVMAIIGSFMLAIGVMLLGVPGQIPLALAIIVGAIGTLYTVISLNWDTIVSTITNVFNEVINWVKTYGLLVLGVLLILTVAGIPFGLSIIFDWAKQNAGKVELADTIIDKVKSVINEIKSCVENAFTEMYSWLEDVVNSISSCANKMVNGIVDAFNSLIDFKDNLQKTINDWISSVWSSVKGFWDTNIAKFFTIDYWKELGKNCIDGLSNGFKTGVNGIISWIETLINSISSCANKMVNNLINALNTISFEMPNWAILGDLAGKKYGINIPNVNFSEIKIPRLAQGAVIPANREFLAVLGDQKQGTNIETPLSTMIEAFNTALEGYRGSGDTTVILEVDGREFGRAVVQSSNKENRRIGTKLVVI